MVSGLAPVAGASCASLLVPAIDPDDPQAGALREESVASVLSAIGREPGTAGTGGTWVTTDGRWSNGVLSGAWRKDQAGYIGEGAREAARRARIESLERELDEERAAIEGIDADLADIEARQELLAEEHRTVPPDGGVREAHTGAAVRAQGARPCARDDHAAAVAVCQRRQEELAAARARAAEFAADVGLPADPDELAGVRAGVGAYRVALAAAMAGRRGGARRDPRRGRRGGGTRRQPSAAARGERAGRRGAGGGRRGGDDVPGAARHRRHGGRGTAAAAGRGDRCPRPAQDCRAGRPSAGTGGARGARQGGRETGRTADAGR